MVEASLSVDSMNTVLYFIWAEGAIFIVKAIPSAIWCHDIKFNEVDVLANDVGRSPDLEVIHLVVSRNEIGMPELDRLPSISTEEEGFRWTLSGNGILDGFKIWVTIVIHIRWGKGSSGWGWKSVQNEISRKSLREVSGVSPGGVSLHGSLFDRSSQIGEFYSDKSSFKEISIFIISDKIFGEVPPRVELTHDITV